MSICLPLLLFSDDLPLFGSDLYSPADWPVAARKLVITTSTHIGWKRLIVSKDRLKLRSLLRAICIFTKQAILKDSSDRYVSDVGETFDP